MDKIFLVLASDNKGSKYLATTIVSVLENKLESSQCFFYILTAPDFQEQNKVLITNLVQRYSGAQICFCDMGDAFSQTKCMIPHITSPTYYRLKIPQILPPECKIAIYLDIDIIVKHDLAVLSNLNLGEDLIAGVVAAGFQLCESCINYHKSIGIEDTKNYVNAGVTLWNVERLRRMQDMPVLLEQLALKNFDCQDQDVINLAFQGRIKMLPLKYNYMTKYDSQVKKRVVDMLDIYGEAEIEEALNNPTIIHYADRDKPWNYMYTPHNSEWWRYAVKTPYCKELVSSRRHLYLQSFAKKMYRSFYAAARTMAKKMGVRK